MPIAQDDVLNLSLIHICDGIRAVVLVHGGRFNKESWKKQAQVLSDSGFRVLAIDFRGYGQTKAGTTTVDDNSYPDVLTAVRYLHSTGSNSVSVVGASMGLSLIHI